MMELNFEQARTNMIKQQLLTWDVFDEAVLEVISDVPRERFVPEKFRNLAFVDMELPLGQNQVMMAPRVEARMLQALDIQRTEQVLEIGTGSGFTTACLARLGHHVETIDIFDELSAQAKQNLAANGTDNVTLRSGDVYKDWNAENRYDIIAVTGSIPEYDERFEAALQIGGRMFVIVGERPVMEAMLVMRTAQTEFLRSKIFETEITPLVNAKRTPKFVF